MRLFHTSDWHLGRQTYGHSRVPDHDAVIDEMVAIAEDFRPHLILHTGDLYDVARPGERDAQRGVDALHRLSLVAPVVVLLGNHESGGVFRLFQSLLGPDRGITFVDRTRDPRREDAILRFPGDDGEQILVASVPFVTASRAIDPFNEGTTWLGTYAQQVAKIEKLIGDALRKGFNATQDIAVFAAHLNLNGAIYSKSERQIHCAAEYATRVEDLPPVSYAAFGHIHKPQPLPGNVTGCYAGSPIQLDFGEEGEVKSVVLVEARPGRAAAVRREPLWGARTLIKIEGTLDDIGDAAGRVGRNFAHVTVLAPTAIDNLADEVAQRLPDATLVDVVPKYADRTVVVLRDGAETETDTEPSLSDLFREYLARKRLKAKAADVVEAFEAMVNAVETMVDPEIREAEALSARLVALDAQTAPDGHVADVNGDPVGERADEAPGVEGVLL